MQFIANTITKKYYFYSHVNRLLIPMVNSFLGIIIYIYEFKNQTLTFLFKFGSSQVLKILKKIIY